MGAGCHAFDGWARDAKLRPLDDLDALRCPYCFEPADLWIDPQTEGEMVEDCAVCCRPWRVVVSRDHDGRAQVYIERAQ